MPNNEVFRMIRNMINQIEAGDFSGLPDFREQYPWDARSHAFKALEQLLANDHTAAVDALRQFVHLHDYSFDPNYNYWLAQAYEASANYEQALNLYEKVLAELENNRMKPALLKTIDNVYEKLVHHKPVQAQKKDGLPAQRNTSTLHIMNDHIYCKTYIENLLEHFPEEEHHFLIFPGKNGFVHIKENAYPNTYFYTFSGWESFMQVNVEQHILPLIYRNDRIVVHFLKDFVCWLICRYNITKQLYWIVWGGDLYDYLDYARYDESHTLKAVAQLQLLRPSLTPLQQINMRYRRGFIRRLTGIYTFFDHEYDLIKQHYHTTANCENYYYPNPIDTTELDRAVSDSEQICKNRFEFLVMVGHSGFPENNHLEIFHQLKQHDGNFGILVPLAYGIDAYIDHIIQAGRELFGDRFVPLTDFMDPESYAQLLKEVDIALFNSNRQIGVGNIRSLLYLEKKVFLKPDTATYATLTKHGVQIYDITQLKERPIREWIALDDPALSKNREIISEIYSVERFIKLHKQLF